MHADPNKSNPFYKYPPAPPPDTSTTPSPQNKRKKKHKSMNMSYENPILALPCYLRLSEAARLAYGVSRAELDDFLMYEFKVRRCGKAYPHQWVTCPYAHRGEKARRRDPRRFPNHGVPCPEFRQDGACRRGHKCEFAHGVFEFWLHPTRYRTRMCVAGPACARKICFFAHSVGELRPEGVATLPPASGGGRIGDGPSEVRREREEEPDLRWVYELVD